MDGDDRFGLLVDVLLHFIRSHVQRSRIAIDKDGRCSSVHNTISRGGKAEGGGNDFVIRFDTQGNERQVQTSRPGADADAVPSPYAQRHEPFEFLEPRSDGKTTASHRFDNAADFCVRNIGVA